MPRQIDQSRDLFFGMLALRIGLIEQGQLVAALKALARIWPSARSPWFFLSRIGSRAQSYTLMGTTSEPAIGQPDERGTLQQAVGGDQAAWAQLLAPHRNRLRRPLVLRARSRP